jgi:tripartite ATP-independent transporter DctM subunit
MITPVVVTAGAIALLISVPIAAVIAFITFGLGLTAPVSIAGVLGMTSWSQSEDYIIIAIPLFILFGDMMVRSGIAGSMYDALSPWLTRLPGKLMQTNLFTSAIFAATSGSSVATAATIGSVAIPQCRKNGYNERLFLGSIAAGGTLGILIPPSINMIVFGSITGTSIPQLYMAGFLPGLLLLLAFAVVTAIACILWPHLDGAASPSTWRERIAALPSLIPPLLIFLAVVGSIYVGIATPTEAAALGVATTGILVATKRRLTFALVNASLLNTARITAMLMLILVAASFLNFTLSFIGFGRQLESFIIGQDWPPYAVIFGIVGFYIVLGTFLDAMPMTILTAPTLTPIVVQLGFDPVWFGIIVVLVSEIGLITPPMGMNCYVVQGVRGSGALHDVFIGVSPFILALLAVLGALIAFPQIALWLPQTLLTIQ